MFFKQTSKIASTTDQVKPKKE
eukprot:SAG31_NODE_17368_length_673_cov_1.512195_1_plen_21_part_10